jgi:hypothetical protein
LCRFRFDENITDEVFAYPMELPLHTETIYQSIAYYTSIAIETTKGEVFDPTHPIHGNNTFFEMHQRFLWRMRHNRRELLSFSLNAR